MEKRQKKGKTRRGERGKAEELGRGVRHKEEVMTGKPAFLTCTNNTNTHFDLSYLNQQFEA